MKRKTMHARSIVPLAALFAVMASASHANAQTRLNGPNSLWIESDHAAVELAELRAADGGMVKFFALPETQELVYGEIVPVGAGERFFFSDEANTPLERFLALTSSHVPVPRLLVELSESLEEDKPDSGASVRLHVDDRSEAAGADRNRAMIEALAERVIVETLPAPVPATLARPFASSAAATGGSCGAQGAAYFKENHCGSMGPYGYGVSQTHCDNGSSGWIQRTSTQPMRHTYTRIAACGAYGKTIHSRNSVSGFTTVFTGYNTPNTVASWYSYKKGISWKRRARFERVDDSGYVRGWTRFFKQVTSNAP